MTEFTQSITLRPAYDCLEVQPCQLGSADCVPGGGGNHGRSSARQHYALQGPRGAIVFQVSTGWYHPATPADIKNKLVGMTHVHAVVIHRDTPAFEGDAPIHNCEYVTTGDCFVDMSYTLGGAIWDKFVSEGDEALWAELQLVYAEHIGPFEDDVNDEDLPDIDWE